jgi:hypothetical protein
MEDSGGGEFETELDIAKRECKSRLRKTTQEGNALAAQESEVEKLLKNAAVMDDADEANKRKKAVSGII